MSNDGAAMDDLLVYWRQGEAIQNFGDFLSQYLFEELFLPIPLHPGRTYLIGSVIADFLVDAQTTTAPCVVFWGCGAREAAGLSAEAAAKARILAVRGPLTASALKLGATVPRGDPALLLPALYTPKAAVSAGRSVCIPHFWDDRTDAEQLAMSGCEQVLRPNLPNSRRRLLEMMDAIAASEFVLSASLHGAIVAAAYGRPFAFWDNGHLDVPFKWQDTAALLGVPAVFASDLAMGRTIHRDQIAPTLSIPPLSPLLFNAPFPLRPEAVLRVLAHELPTQGDPSAVLLDWSAGLAAAGVDATTTVHNLGQQLTLERLELARADHRVLELGAELAAAQLEAKDKISALSAAQADASKAQDAAALALLAAQAEASEARNATALALAERDEAERRIGVALKQWETFGSAVTSSFELPPCLDPRALSHQVESALAAHRHDTADARAQANDLKAELSAAGEEATLARLALTEMTQARDGALERLTKIARTEIRLREALRSAAVRSQYEHRFVTDAKAARQTQSTEIDALHEQVTQAASQRDRTEAEIRRLQAELVVAHSDLSASARMGQEAVAEAKALRIELDQTSKRLQKDLVSYGRLEEELHSSFSKIGVLKAELATLNATTIVKTMRWAASTLPVHEKLKLAAKVSLRAFVRRAFQRPS